MSDRENSDMKFIHLRMPAPLVEKEAFNATLECLKKHYLTHLAIVDLVNLIYILGHIAAENAQRSVPGLFSFLRDHARDDARMPPSKEMKEAESQALKNMQEDGKTPENVISFLDRIHDRK